MNPITTYLDEIEARVKAATPWLPDDKNPASKEWRNNLENNAELCRHAYADITTLIAIVRRHEKTIEEMDCTCGSESADSDHSHIDGGCYKHEARADVAEIIGKGKI